MVQNSTLSFKIKTPISDIHRGHFRMLSSDQFVCLAGSIASLARSSGVARVAAAVEIAGGAELPFVVAVAEMQFHESRSAAAAAGRRRRQCQNRRFSENATPLTSCCVLAKVNWGTQKSCPTFDGVRRFP